MAPAAASTWRRRLSDPTGHRSGAEPREPGRTAHRRGSVVALVLFVVLATAFFIRGFVIQDAWVGGRGDEVLESWYLDWVPWAITHGHNPLFTTYVDYPLGVNVMWNTSLPLLGVLGAPIGWLFGARAEYHVWLTLGVALSAFFAYLFARRRVGWLPAVVAGTLYGFSPFVLYQSTGHLHESVAVAPPLLLMLLDDLLVRRTRSPVKAGAYLGLLVAAQVLVGEELTATMLLMAPIALAILALLNLQHLRASLRLLVVAVTVAVPVALVLLAYPLYVQFFGAQRLQGAVQVTNFYVTDLANLVVPNREYFTPPQAVALAGSWAGGESSAYLSVTGVLLFAVLLVLCGRGRMVRWCAVMAVIAFVLSLGPSLHVAGSQPGINLPWAAIDRVPILQSMLPARLSMYLFLFMGLMVASGLEAARHRARALSTGVWALTLLTLLAMLHPTPTSTQLHPVPAFFTSGAVNRVPLGSVALVAPWTIGHYAPDIGTDTAPLLWQNAASFRFRMPSGYALVPTSSHHTSFIPPTGRDLRRILNDIRLGGTAPDPTDPAVRLQALTEMRELTIRSVIVGPMTNRSLAVTFFARLLGRPGQELGGVTFWSGPFTP